MCARQALLVWWLPTSWGNLQLTCEIDLICSNMDVYIEKVLLLYDIPASSSAADALQELDLVCCATIVYLRNQSSP